jgi:tetratricopeptide (TPR) repeat protein
MPAPPREDKTRPPPAAAQETSPGGGAGRQVAPEESLEVYQGKLRTAAELLATAQEDRELVRQLMAMPAPERIEAAVSDTRFHRRTLARMLALDVESALGDPARDPRPAAELGAAIAAALPHDPKGQAPGMAAWAYWLLGKALLRASQWRLAEDTFRSISAFHPGDDAAPEPEALAWSGLAQLHEDLGHEQQAAAMFLRAAFLHALGRAWAPGAACQAQLGLLLHQSGELESAVRPLRAALGLFDAAFAPSLAARLRLALADIETVLGHAAAASRELEQARALYPLAPSPAEEIERSWSEARIVVAAGKNEEAEALFERVRRELLARGSLAEAALCSCEQLLIQIEGCRFGAARELAEDLAVAFPPAGEPWAQELTNLVRLAIEEPSACHLASNELRRRLRLREAARHAGRPALLVPARVLADRLFCGCGELEDPIGAAAESEARSAEV